MENKKITCGIYLFDETNRILIGHPTNYRATVWGVPKGRPEIGETDFFEVAKRELYEETSILLNDYTILYKEEFQEVKYKSSNKYLKGFFVKIKENLSDFELCCDSMVMRNGIGAFPETDELKWVSIDSANEIFSNDIISDFQLININRCKELLEDL